MSTSKRKSKKGFVEAEHSKSESGHNLSTRSLHKLDLSQFRPGSFDGIENVKEFGIEEHPDGIFSKDDEVWILECSKNINIREFLEGSKINLAGVTNLRSGDSVVSENQSVEWIATGLPKLNDDRPTESLVTLFSDSDGSTQLVAAPISGYLQVREKVDSHHLHVLPEEPSVLHVISDSLKQRHPFNDPEISDKVSATKSKTASKYESKRVKREREESKQSSSKPRKKRKME